jgi:hypothetical protein
MRYTLLLAVLILGISCSTDEKVDPVNPFLGTWIADNTERAIYDSLTFMETEVILYEDGQSLTSTYVRDEGVLVFAADQGYLVIDAIYDPVPYEWVKDGEWLLLYFADADG